MLKSPIIYNPSKGRDRIIFLKCSINAFTLSLGGLYITPAVIGVGVLVMLMNSVSIIDPLSEGLVIPPLRVEKLSPRLNFF